MERRAKRTAASTWASGFAVFVAPGDVAATIAAARSSGHAAWACGVVETGPRRVLIEPLGIEYAADELALRG